MQATSMFTDTRSSLPPQIRASNSGITASSSALRSTRNSILTGGRYRSTPHRVRNHAGRDRYSLPYFLDPGWDAVVDPLSFADEFDVSAAHQARWDKANLSEISGTYGTWLSAKVGKVFPALADEVLS